MKDTRLKPSTTLFPLNGTSPYDVFYSNMVRQWGGLARSNRFSVSIGYLGNRGENANWNLLCEKAVFPGKTVQIAQSNIAGLTENVAKSFDYNGSVILTFLVDRNYKIRRFFDEWMDDIVRPVRPDNPVEPVTFDNFSTREDILRNFPLSQPATADDFKPGKSVGFFNDYVSTITIQSLDRTETFSSWTINLYEAYPVSISPIQFSNASQDFVRMEVAFNFTKWIYTKQDDNIRNIDINFDSVSPISRRILVDFFAKRPKLFLSITLGSNLLKILRDRVLKNNRNIAKILRKIDSIPFDPIKKITKRF